MAVLLAVLAVPVLCVAAAAGTATGATVPGRHASPASYSWFQLKSADYRDSCIVEKGTASGIYGAGCSSNHSDYWRWTSTGELLNEHSGLCLSVTGYEPGVYVNKCVNNHAQLWNTQSIDVFANGTLYVYDEFVNVHTGESLGLVLGASVVQESSGDTVWDLT
jgi:hypothetical protein